MSRLTTNKPVDEMSMLELTYNSCYAKDGKAMYEDFETVRDARDFARSLYKAYLNEELPTDDEEFDGRMMDDLQYESEVHLNGLIALFYRNLWAMADLRETLKSYEDKQEQGLLLELKPIKGFEEYYAVDMFGCVYGISEENNNGRRIVKRKATLHKTGYEYITLKAKGQVKNARIHRLVAEAFIPNPHDYPDVNHIDGNKANNCVWNLEWCSKSHNTNHAIANGLMKPPTNFKDGVWKNGNNKFALITNTKSGESQIFDSFNNATTFLKRGKDYIWQHLSKGIWDFNSREYRVQVFLTRSEAEEALAKMGGKE